MAAYHAIKIEKLKKAFNVQTYKEILAFVEKKQLSNDEKLIEKGKRGYEKIFLAVGTAILTVIVYLIMFLCFK